MSHLPHPRRCRTLLYTLLLLSIFTIVFKSQLPFEFPTSTTRPPLNEYLSIPIYEHVSPYRQYANHTFEGLLEAQLIRIESSIKSAIEEQEKNARAQKTIWQITSSPEEASVWKQWTTQWHHTNPEWEIKSYTTSPAPDILPYFRSIPSINQSLSSHPELSLDIFRWLFLWYHGGFYIEPDIWPRVAIKDCFDTDSIEHPSLSLPRKYPNSSSRYVEQKETSSPISLVLGVDIDEPYMAPHIREKWGWTRNFGFGTYAIWAPGRFDPLLRKAIVRCISHSAQTSLFGDTVDTKELGEVCGGAMLTDIILEILTSHLKDVHPIRDMDAGLERRVTWKKFRSLKQPYWFSRKDFKDGSDIDENVRGLGILPVNVWGSGQRHSGSAGFGSEDACLNHVFGKRPDVSFSRRFLDRLFLS